MDPAAVERELTEAYGRLQDLRSKGQQRDWDLDAMQDLDVVMQRVAVAQAMLTEGRRQNG